MSVPSPAQGEDPGKVTANAPSLYTVADLTMPAWEVELSHADGWDCVQLASVNNRSDLTLPADDGEGLVQFTGWRVTLSPDALEAHIRNCSDVLARMRADKD